MRDHLKRLLELGFVKRLGRKGAPRWTLTELLLPDAVFDASTEAAYLEAHAVPSQGSAAQGGPQAQRPLPFETAALAARLAGPDPFRAMPSSSAAQAAAEKQCAPPGSGSAAESAGRRGRYLGGL